MNKEIYLTDAQYEQLLQKVEVAIEANEVFHVVDSTEIGNKYTTSNVGLCNEGFTEHDTALFPEQFIKHGRKAMKYRQMHHICPFDTRLQQVEENKQTNLSNGCFYTCSLRTKRTDKENLFNLLERTKELLRGGRSKEKMETLNNLYFGRYSK